MLVIMSPFPSQNEAKAFLKDYLVLLYQNSKLLKQFWILISELFKNSEFKKVVWFYNSISEWNVHCSYT